MKQTPKIYLAPMQGFTDYIYRNAYRHYFHGIDKYFTPYLVVENNGSIRSSKIKEIIPNNNNDSVIPQILPANGKELLLLLNAITNYPYSEININMACPYPMVTRRGRGAGLLTYPDRIDEILDTAFSKHDLRFSLKIRAGLSSFDEINHLIDLLNKYPLSEVILHPRIATQLYKGEPDIDTFLSVKKKLNHPLVYNGDIFSTEEYEGISTKISGQNLYMLGRGILENPFLPEEIKNSGETYTLEGRNKILKQFHDELFSNYLSIAPNKKQLLIKMTQFWEYFSHSFINPAKVYKKIKKATTIDRYQSAIEEIF